MELKNIIKICLFRDYYFKKFCRRINKFKPNKEIPTSKIFLTLGVCSLSKNMTLKESWYAVCDEINERESKKLIN